jgi:hypothetical protein
MLIYIVMFYKLVAILVSDVYIDYYNNLYITNTIYSIIMHVINGPGMITLKA